MLLIKSEILLNDILDVVIFGLMGSYITFLLGQQEL